MNRTRNPEPGTRNRKSASFLSPLLREPDRPWVLGNADTAAVLAHHVHAAVDSASRRRGLLGREGLADEALVIAPCSAVHTFFMRFAIDVIFTDRSGRICRCVPGVRPWRLTAALHGFATIELAAGTIAQTGTLSGHRLELRALDRAGESAGRGAPAPLAGRG